MAQKEFTIYRTHHGPVVRELDGKWVSVRLMQEPLKALHAVVLAHQGDAATSRSATRWSSTPTRRTTRSTPTPTAPSRYFHSNFIPEARPEVRLDQAGGRQRSGDGMERRAVDRRDARPAQPGERLALQRQQLAVVGGRPDSPKKRTIPAYVDRGIEREPARRPRDRSAPEQEGLHARLAARGRVSTAICRRSTSDSALVKAWDAAPAGDAAEDEAVRADRAAARMGLPLVGRRRCRRRSAVYWGEEIGRRVGDDSAQGRRLVRRYIVDQARRRISCCRRWPPRPTSSRPTSAAGRRRGATSIASSASPATSCSRSTTRAEHSGRLHLVALGLAGVVRRAHLPGHEEDVRHQRQQLRRGGRVRRPACARGR